MHVNNFFISLAEVLIVFYLSSVYVSKFEANQTVNDLFLFYLDNGGILAWNYGLISKS